MRGSRTPCAACRYLRRKCVETCVFAPYFCNAEGPSNFAAVHKVFGASNFSKLISRLPEHDRCDAVRSLCYEAHSRLRDPIYGSVSQIFSLHQQVVSLQAQVALLREEASRKSRQEEQGKVLAQVVPQVVSDFNLNQMSDVAPTSMDHNETLSSSNESLSFQEVMFPWSPVT
ncbi:unnamed protein product [Microthlaspi erraticum]|uniref:LOB domain-containing protein n=1 Tax=Microthlaspi erraticum TaxID=1685480 RepID=A0A6D2IBD0_9BRAS|nr:unnamed protein product [Microthlaspi erraticum]